MWSFPRVNAEGFQYRPQPFPRIDFTATLGNLELPLRTLIQRSAVLLHPFHLDNCFQLRDGALQYIVNQNITILAIILNFLLGLIQAELQFVLIDRTLGTHSITKSGAQDLWIGRHDEDADGLGKLLPYLLRTLDIDVQQQVAASRRGLVERAARGAVEVLAEELGKLQEFVSRDHPFKFFAGGEVVLTSVLL